MAREEAPRLAHYLERPGWSDYVWSAHDKDEIGPGAFRKYIEKQTGLRPEDL